MRIVVVGAGIMGASLAYHAAAAGAGVVLVESGRPGGGVTVDSFAWIGASGVRTGRAAELRLTTTREYHRLVDELPGLPVTWSGSLIWGAGDDPPPAGPGQQIIDGARAAQIEPRLVQPPRWALWAAEDGAIDAVDVVNHLVRAARERGARILSAVPVRTLRRDGAGRVVGVETDGGFLAADVVVLAAGVATAELAATIGVEVPIGPSPSRILRFRAPADLVRTVVSNQDFDLRQAGPDRLIAAADSPELALAAVRSTFIGAEGVELVDTRVGARPMPADGEPIIGRVESAPGLYLAVMHAAVTLAAAVGRLAVQELVSETSEPLLEGCRLSRFTA